MANWFVGQLTEKLIFGPILDKLINAGFEYLQYQPRMKDMLKRLRDISPEIQAIVSVARRKQLMDQDMDLNKWIWQIRDTIDEADDFFDELDYLNLKEEKKVRSISNIPTNPAKRLCVGNKVPLDLKKLEELVQKLDNIFARACAFLHLLKIIKEDNREEQFELHKTRETGSFPINELIGREDDKKYVIEWLSRSSNEELQTHAATTTTLYKNISLLSIVGHGGMGKTTLLQHVFQDEIVKEFDLKIWVCVSDKFDADKVIKDMLECLQKKKKRSSLETLTALQDSLRSEVMSKKFLLVFDDLWDKEEENVLRCKWGNVLAPLAHGGLGSKILITTRMDSVATIIAKVITKKKETRRLEGLNENECLEILTTHAFADAENNTNDHKKLRSLARELVKKLYGSPLVAKVMGGALNSNLDEVHWRNVLNSSLGLNDFFSILKLSYTFLPKYLQSCFSFCSIFEQDYIFDKHDLIRMWIALGFIQPSHNKPGVTLTLEDIGEMYFDALIKKSFFAEVINPNTEMLGYKMHDLINELAKSVSEQECFRFVGGDENLLLGISETIRHLSIEIQNPIMLKYLRRFKNLRTLIITCCSSFDESFVDALNEMFKEIRSIRLVYMHYDYFKEVPDGISYLLHLRYLKFDSFHLKLSARSLSSLYHLQFLVCDRDWEGDVFLRDMNNLVNLRYLSFQLTNFPEIGKLKFLKELNEFCVRNENGYRIDELEHMNQLCKLGLCYLNNVTDVEEACKARLCDKIKLTHFILSWYHAEDVISYRALEEGVLDKLQPHYYLKTLEIISYMGARSAFWMNDAHSIENLEDIKLSFCLEWEILPPFGQLPFLESLSLWYMPKVKRFENKFHGNNNVCSVFPLLEKLHFTCLEALVDWFDADVVDGLFPCLTELELSNCPNLQELPYLPPKLESLKMNNIGWKTLNCCSISKSISLKTLVVCRCQNITSISMAGGEMGKLKRLKIVNCPNLISLGEERQEEVDVTENWQLILDDLTISDPSLLQLEPLKSCTSITSLAFENNDKLVSIPLEAEQWILQLGSSLRQLSFKFLPSLESLPDSLASISSLETLCVHNLPRLRALPNLPPSLKITGNHESMR